jgi:nucleoporin NUP2
MDAASRSGSQPTVSDEGTQDDARLLPTSNHDGEGEGEEDEETTYTVKAKVFKLLKTSDKSEWKELGIGQYLFVLVSSTIFLTLDRYVPFEET